jgi:hypothetical protein
MEQVAYDWMPMGAWGHGGFENDDAADWVHEFELQGASAVVPALEYVSKLPEDEYLDTPEASVGLSLSARLDLRDAGLKQMVDVRVAVILAHPHR